MASIKFHYWSCDHHHHLHLVLALVRQRSRDQIPAKALSYLIKRSKNLHSLQMQIILNSYHR